MKKIVVVFGTRPEAIKLAPVIEALKRLKAFRVTLCSTGQHREMLKQVLTLFKLKVDYDLALMQPNQDLFDITAGTLLKLRGFFAETRPDLVVVQGDTTTAFATALAAFYCKIPVAHVEAALRSYNNYSPFPEEVNRRSISVVADYHFAPTAYAARNLLAEGVTKSRVFITGNTVVDSLLQVNRVLEAKGTAARLAATLRKLCGDAVFTTPYVLITLHRREKFGSEFKGVLKTIARLAAEYPKYNFVYPVHLNPNVKGPVDELLSGTPNIRLLPPQDYLHFTYLMKHCRFIITDSGGIQEECHTFKKPVLVLRDVTERMEAVDAGYALLTGSNPETIYRAFRTVDRNLTRGHNYFTRKNPYGNGRAADAIAAVIKKHLYYGTSK